MSLRQPSQEGNVSRAYTNESSFNTSQTSTLSQKKKRKIEDFEPCDSSSLAKLELYKGAGYDIKIVQDKENKRKRYMMRTITKKELADPTKAASLKQEIKEQKKLEHPHVLRMSNFFEDKENVYLIFELAKLGSMRSYLERKKRIEEKEAFIYIFQTCIGLDYLHKKGLYHRDVKPDNILLDAQKNVKLSNMSANSQDVRLRNLKQGLLDYVAPEVINNKTEDHKVDIWSLGVMAFEMVHGFTPFKGTSNEETQSKILKGKYKCGDISDEFKDLINNLLQLDPEDRSELMSIFRHPFMRMHELQFNISHETFIYAAGPSSKNEILTDLKKEQQDMSMAMDPKRDSVMADLKGHKPDMAMYVSPEKPVVNTPIENVLKTQDLNDSREARSAAPIRGILKKGSRSRSRGPSDNNNAASPVYDNRANRGGQSDYNSTASPVYDNRASRGQSDFNSSASPVYNNRTSRGGQKEAVTVDLSSKSPTNETYDYRSNRDQGDYNNATSPVYNNRTSRGGQADYNSSASPLYDNRTSRGGQREVAANEVPYKSPRGPFDNRASKSPTEYNMVISPRTPEYERNTNRKTLSGRITNSNPFMQDRSSGFSSIHPGDPEGRTTKKGVEMSFQEEASSQENSTLNNIMDQFNGGDGSTKRNNPNRNTTNIQNAPNLDKKGSFGPESGVAFQDHNRHTKVANDILMKKRTDPTKSTALQETPDFEKKMSFGPEEGEEFRPTRQTTANVFTHTSYDSQENSRQLRASANTRVFGMPYDPMNRINKGDTSQNDLSVSKDRSRERIVNVTSPKTEEDYDTQRKEAVRNYKNKINSMFGVSPNRSQIDDSSFQDRSMDNSRHVSKLDQEIERQVRATTKNLEKNNPEAFDKERFIEDPNAAKKWLETRQADKDLDLSFMPPELRYNYKTMDQSYTELRNKTQQLEKMMSDEDEQPERVSRPSLRTAKEISKSPKSAEDQGLVAKFFAYFGCMDRESRARQAGSRQKVGQ